MVSIDEDRCTLCGLCLRVCLKGVLKGQDSRIVVADPASCNLCGHCKAVCPADAPTFPDLKENEFERTPEIGPLADPVFFLRFLRHRRSHRIYKNNPVEIEKIKMIIEAGRFAPTGGNRQGCEYIIVMGRELIDRVCTLTIQTLQEERKLVKEALDRHHRLNEPIPEEYVTMQYYPSLVDRIAERWRQGRDELLYRAPVLILVHMRQGLTSNPQVDASISATHMILMAETLGLGTCVIGFISFALNHSKELGELLEVPSDHQVHVAITAGYSDIKFVRLVARHPAKVKWIGEFSGEKTILH